LGIICIWFLQCNKAVRWREIKTNWFLKFPRTKLSTSGFLVHYMYMWFICLFYALNFWIKFVSLPFYSRVFFVTIQRTVVLVQSAKFFSKCTIRGASVYFYTTLNYSKRAVSASGQYTKKSAYHRFKIFSVLNSSQTKQINKWYAKWRSCCLEVYK